MMKFGMLFNQKTGRYHPILFRWGPTPSGSFGGHDRYKSKGHHTEGFDTPEEARTYIETTCASNPSEFVSTEWRGEWDGEGIPALIAWFPN